MLSCLIVAVAQKDYLFFCLLKEKEYAVSPEANL